LPPADGKEARWDFATTKVASHQATDAAAASVKIVANLPFIIAINGFGGDVPHPAGDVGEALSVGAQVPVVECDASERNSTAATLSALVEHAIAGHRSGW
jgi:signal recognition particle receptor subunit beta